MKQPLECPVDFITVNEYKVRIVAAFVFALSLSYLYFQHWLLPLVLTCDFCMRAFNGGRYSPLQWLSGIAEKILPLAHKPTDRGPKRFAASIGFVISLLVILAAVFGFKELSFYLIGLIVLFSFLEFSVGFCAGCWVYTFIKRTGSAE